MRAVIVGILAGLGVLNLLAWLVGFWLGTMPLFMHIVYIIFSSVGALLAYLITKET